MAKKGGNSSEKYGQHRDVKERTDKIYDDSSNTKKLLIFPIETVLLHMLLCRSRNPPMGNNRDSISYWDSDFLLSFFPNRQLKTGSPLGKDIHERMYKEQK